MEKNTTAQNMWTTAGDKMLDGREGVIKVSFQARRTAAEPPAKVRALAGLGSKNIKWTLAEKLFLKKSARTGSEQNPPFVFVLV
jgi:hypothetical protein